MKTLLTSLLAILLIQAASCRRTNVAGKWTGQFIDAESNRTPAMLVLTQSGSTLTGTAGPDAAQQWAIRNGKVDVDSVAFDVAADQSTTLRFSLKLTDKHLKGDVKAETFGQTHTATVDVIRVDSN